MILQTLTAAGFTFRLEGETGEFTITLAHRRIAEGLDELDLTLQASAPAVPKKLSLAWNRPAVDLFCLWLPAFWRNHCGLPVHWSDQCSVGSMATQNAPLACLLNQNGHNRLTLAFSDTLNPVKTAAGVHEETATVECRIDLFETPQTPVAAYTATLRLDRRDIPYGRAIGEAVDWWASLPGMEPSCVPEHARLPMYSTWYSMHQNLTPAGIEHQCRLAKEIGCESVIVDDGWQTEDSNRGYAYCGDWEVAPGRIPDMAAHVAAVHAIGLKYILWYAVPFVGKHSRAFRRFTGKFLDYDESKTHWTLDPRFPEVREYLISTYENAMLNYGLDGFKLDFVDAFVQSERSAKELGGGRDYDSVPAAADRLLSDVMTRLRLVKPDVLIEFRQAYNGPRMRKYGNMFRAVDCPGDLVLNRIRILDVRLLCGTTAAHADMMMWHADESAACAAMQLLHTFFAVPQISVLLDQVPRRHLDMLKFWLGVWSEHRDVIMDGALTAHQPECQFPMVSAVTAKKQIVALYAPMIAEIDATKPLVLIVNGTQSPSIVLKSRGPDRQRRLQTFDCTGTPVLDQPLSLGGVQEIPLPPAGLGVITG